MITIKQLASLAKVSPSTVVNVLHGRSEKVKEETFKRVQKVICEAEYTPNMGGRLLKNSESRIIGVIITWARRDDENIVQDPFFGEIIGALENEIRSRGYFMMLYISENAAECINMAKSWLVDGLIVMGGLPDDCSLFLRKMNMPLVFIDAFFHNDGLPYVNVGLEDRRGAFLMTEYLIKKGHSRIAFVVDGDPPIGSGQERLFGFHDAMKQYNLPVSNSNCISVSYKLNERHAFYKKFSKSKMNDYSALFFFSDFYAMDAITFLTDIGFKIPDDISICGFDNNIFASHCRPRLCTVCQSVSEKAVHAITQLFKLIKKEPLENRIIRLDVSLFEGKSVKNLSKNN